MKEHIEEILHRRGVLIIPDFVANAGGVISSYAEHKGMNAKKMFTLVEEKVTKSMTALLAELKHTNRVPREIANELALRRITKK